MTERSPRGERGVRLDGMGGEGGEREEGGIAVEMVELDDEGSMNTCLTSVRSVVRT